MGPNSHRWRFQRENIRGKDSLLWNNTWTKHLGGAGIGGLDQTSYKSELWALYKLIKSIAGMRGSITIIIDNQAVAREAALRKMKQGTKGINCEGLLGAYSERNEHLPTANV